MRLFNNVGTIHTVALHIQLECLRKYHGPGIGTVGARVQICMLGLKPYLLMWIRPRRSK